MVTKLKPRRSHRLKTHPDAFAATLEGRKRFEWRKDDRGYREGDRLLLREFDPETAEYSGRTVECTVTYILRARYGVPAGWCVLGVKV